MAYNPAPGAMQPGKYDRVGPNYNRYGEQPGYVYYPPQDRYYLDPAYAKKYGQTAGYIAPDPKKPGLGDTLLPIAATGGALSLGSALGKNPVDFLSGIADKLGLGAEGKGLFGLGATKAPVVAATSADAAAPLAELGSMNLPTGIGVEAPQFGADLSQGLNFSTALDTGLDTSAPGLMGLGSTAGADAGNVAANTVNAGDAGTGLFGLGGTTAGNLLGAAGIGLGGYNAFEGIKNHNPIAAGLGGAGVGLGLNSLGYALGPYGWAASVAAPIALSLLSKAFDHKSTGEIQADRWKGSGAPADVIQKMKGYDYFTGTGGMQNRDESFLTPDAIRYNPDNYHNIQDWDSWSKQNQDQFLQTMLNEGKVQERKGGIYYDDARAQEVANAIRQGQNPAAPPPPPPGAAGAPPTMAAPPAPAAPQQVPRANSYGPVPRRYVSGVGFV